MFVEKRRTLFTFEMNKHFFSPNVNELFEKKNYLMNVFFHVPLMFTRPGVSGLPGGAERGTNMNCDMNP